jgi:hypothetical protein
MTDRESTTLFPLRICSEISLRHSARCGSRSAHTSSLLVCTLLWKEWEVHRTGQERRSNSSQEWRDGFSSICEKDAVQFKHNGKTYTRREFEKLVRG